MKTSLKLCEFKVLAIFYECFAGNSGFFALFINMNEPTLGQ